MLPRELKGNVSPSAKSTSTFDSDTDESGSEIKETQLTTQQEVLAKKFSSKNSNVMAREVSSNENQGNDETQLTTQQEILAKRVIPTKNKKSNAINREDSSDKNQGNSSKTDQPFAVPPQIGPLPSTPMRGKRKRASSARAEDCDADFLKIEQRKLQIFSDSMSKKTDSEYQFLLILVPHMKRIHENRQLIVRNKIQQVLIDEEGRQSSSRYRAPVSYPSPSNITYPSSNTSWGSSQETTQSSWRSQEQPSTSRSLLPPLWDNQTQQSQSLLTFQAVNTAGGTGRMPIGLQPQDDLTNQDLINDDPQINTDYVDL